MDQLDPPREVAKTTSLLEKYNVKADESKSLSISFVEGYIECSYKVFLRYMANVPTRPGANTEYGKALHLGCAVCNSDLQQKAEDRICTQCPKECKAWTKERYRGLDNPDCLFLNMANESFNGLFNEEIQEAVVKSFDGKKKDGEDEVAKMLRMAPKILAQTLLIKQPLLGIVAVEDKIKGEFNGFKVGGVIDLVGVMQGGSNHGKSIMLDYKSRATKPSSSDFPIKQFAMYVKTLEESKGFRTNYLATLYMIKAEPAKKPRTPHEYAYIHYYDLDKNRSVYERTVDLLTEDMEQVKAGIKNGIFIRNRACRYCSTCEVKPYCENPKNLENHLAWRREVECLKK